jgi:hypothetical protein
MLASGIYEILLTDALCIPHNTETMEFEINPNIVSSIFMPYINSK